MRKLWAMAAGICKQLSHTGSLGRVVTSGIPVLGSEVVDRDYILIPGNIKKLPHLHPLAISMHPPVSIPSPGTMSVVLMDSGEDVPVMAALVAGILEWTFLSTSTQASKFSSRTQGEMSCSMMQPFTGGILSRLVASPVGCLYTYPTHWLAWRWARSVA